MKITIKKDQIEFPTSTGQGDKSREKGVICSFCLALEHREALQQIARDAGTTKAQVVRTLIEFAARNA